MISLMKYVDGSDMQKKLDLFITLGRMKLTKGFNTDNYVLMRFHE